MIKFIVKRIWQGTIVLFFISVLAFAIMNAAPGDQASAIYGEKVQMLTSEERERINALFGEDQPVFSRYIHWFNETIHGNLGVSYREGRTVGEIVMERLPNTLLLVGLSLTGIIVFSILLGMKGGEKTSSFWDRGLSIFNITTASIPTFWLGILFIYIFSVQLGLLPSSGTEDITGSGGWLDRLKHVLLPSIVIILSHIGIFAKFLQEKWKEESRKYYVLTARANGVDERWITLGILKNALVPYVHYIGVTIPGFFGGSIVIETLFAWNGLGELSVKAAMTRDYPLLMGTVLILGVIVLISIFITDVITLLLNPKWRRMQHG